MAETVLEAGLSYKERWENRFLEPAYHSERQAGHETHERRSLGLDLAKDCEVIVLGAIGIANTTVAAALLAGLTGLPPDAVCGRGTGPDAQGLEHKRPPSRPPSQPTRPTAPTRSTASVASAASSSPPSSVRCSRALPHGDPSCSTDSPRP
jgi:hypothetical protein